MDTAAYREMLRRHGLGHTLFHAAYRAANAVARVAVWDALVVTPERLDEAILREAQQARGRLLSADAMRPHARDPQNLLTGDFLDRAAAAGDACYAFLEGDVLTSYGWYATGPTRLLELDPRLELGFDPAYVYMYNGFTRPEHRGKRLHAIGMAAALVHYAGLGKRGIVSYVDASNVASQRSCLRMGYERVGRVVVVRVGERHLAHVTAGARRYGFDVRVAGGDPRAPASQVHVRAA